VPFKHLIAALTNPTRAAGLIPGYTQRQMPYGPRRLRHKGTLDGNIPPLLFARLEQPTADPEG
jgi:hypothetical protein